MIPRIDSSLPSPEVIAGELKRPRYVRLRLDRFQRGADNQRIDVALGPVVAGAVTNYVSALVRERAQRLWRQPVSPFSESVVDNFRLVLQDHQRAVIKGARAANRLERVQLYQLSVTRLLLGSVDSELSRLRSELDDARAEPTRQMTGESLQFHQQAVVLGRNLRHVRFLVVRELMREYMHIERGALCRLRKAVLGIAWPVPESMLSSPILQLGGTGDPRDFYRIYPLLLQDVGLGRDAGRCILEAFADWLPEDIGSDMPESGGGAFPATVSRIDQQSAHGFLEIEMRTQGFLGKRELNDCFATWLDQPENAEALLGGKQGHWPQQGPWRHSAIRRLQRALNKRLSTTLNRAGLMRAISASYELQSVYPLSGLADKETQVFDFLNGTVSRRDMLSGLEATAGVADPSASLRRIEELRREYRTGQGADKRQLVARFAADFLRLRRDLKLAWRAFASMDEVRLVMDESTLGGGRDSNRLQVFCRENGVVETAGSVVGHVIVKADIRGIADIAIQMRERKLDPAAHFSRTFYDPVTHLLEQFGARKVVVESDALILSLLEHAGEGAEGLAVARGCCVAAKLIQLLDGINAEHERMGLTPLELGIGVAYADEPPTFLYDHARRVTVSPAIQRARSLSSCHRLLRETCLLPGGRGLRVASQVDAGSGSEVDSLIRYNVNSIELDDVAFTQLNIEIALRRLRRRGKKPATFYAGHCTDVKGENHWLLVRERSIGLWMGGKLVDAGEQGRRFFEVVSDSRLIEGVREKMPPDKMNEADSVPSSWR